MKNKIFISLLAMVSLFMIVGCGSKNENKESNNQKEKIEELGDCEKVIFNYIIDNNFYNQKEVRIASANKFWGFKVSAYNKVGGNLTVCYYFDRKPSSTYESCESEISKIEKKDCDYMNPNNAINGGVFHSYDENDKYYINVKAINQELKKHWEDMGY